MTAPYILFLLALVAFILSIRSFCEKGFLFNNANIYATRQEREKMNKKPYYRQSAIVFLLIGFIFTLNGLAALLSLTWISNIATAVVFIAIVYAIVSTLVIEKNNKRNF